MGNRETLRSPLPWRCRCLSRCFSTTNGQRCPSRPCLTSEKWQAYVAEITNSKPFTGDFSPDFSAVGPNYAGRQNRPSPSAVIAVQYSPRLLRHPREASVWVHIAPESFRAWTPAACRVKEASSRWRWCKCSGPQCTLRLPGPLRLRRRRFDDLCLRGPGGKTLD